MRPTVRFFTMADGARIAFTVMGAGPPLILLPGFLSHLEVTWEAPDTRAFSEALAADFTVIRYDRYGCGLSDRERTDFSREADVRVLSELVDHLRLRRLALFGPSAGGPVAIQYAAANPRRVSHLILFGVGWQAPGVSQTRDALHRLIKADSQLGLNAFAEYLIPGGEPELLHVFARLQREAASADVIVGLSESQLPADFSEMVPGIRVPSLVICRRGDRLLPTESARELAMHIPNARFVTLEGDNHIPEFGDSASLVECIREFLASPKSGPARPPAGMPGLSPRETEVLGLIAAGLGNQDIAARLSISPHTVERHTANIFVKLGVRTRLEAAAYALARSNDTT
jgi:pimeloyl-ACP methyl ester carboxylesterase/DNA-binding CsgD family transcriptional regulator